MSVRVRTENDQVILTTKVKKSCEDGYFQAQENNYPLKNVAEFTKNPTKYLENAFVAGIGPWFSFDNVRTVFQVNGFTLELDHI